MWNDVNKNNLRLGRHELVTAKWTDFDTPRSREESVEVADVWLSSQRWISTPRSRKEFVEVADIWEGGAELSTAISLDTAVYL